MPNIKICLNEFQTLEQIKTFARILNLRFLDYLPCTCAIPCQDHFWALNFYICEPFSKVLWYILRFLECKKMTIPYVLEQGNMQKDGFQRML